VLPPNNPDETRWFADEILPHEPKLRAYLHARFPSLADIDDLVQESYRRLIRTQATGPIACAKAFLFVTARNLALNSLRHRRFERPEGETEIDILNVMDGGPAIPESVTRTEELGLLIQAIESLPERCRQVMTLRKIYGLSQKEVAARLGISESTVEIHGAVGLRKCSEFFRQKGCYGGLGS
jgi:RNA polymerase sigma-70 factor (ECF subfamily)